MTVQPLETHTLQTGGPDVTVNLLGGSSGAWLRRRDGVVTIGAGGLADADLTLDTVDGEPAVDLIMRVRAGRASPERLLVSSRASSVAPHPPFDIGAQTLVPQIPGASLLVQHLKRASIVGALRYYERFEDGVLVERSQGVVGGADVVVENTFARMIEALDADDLIADFGGARVRARDQSALLMIAGIYSQPELRAHLRERQAVNRQLARLASHSGAELWEAARAVGTP